MHWFSKISTWFVAEYIKDYRESRARAFEAITQNNLRLNTVILTVSVAALTAIVALNDKVFANYPVLSIAVIALFISVILLSTINFFLSGLVLSDFQRKLNKDILLPLRASRGEYRPKFSLVQKTLNVTVLSGFCLGLILFLALISFYILGAKP